MDDLLIYKDYWTKVKFIKDEHILHGKIEGINDLVTFDADNLSTVEQEFHNAVDDYLALCAEIGKAPEKPFRGSFSIRITPILHKQLAMEADAQNISLNQHVEDILQKYHEMV